MTQHLPPAIFLMGPTAAGKTDLALALADRLPCDIISVDSVLVYRGMDIGTAKPARDLMQKYPHRLVDILDPVQSYSAAEFCADALREMAGITEQGRIPLLVGGTMLYYRALLQGLADMPTASPEIRVRLEQRARQQGLQTLHDELARVDPESAARIHPNDPQRLIRALEVFLVSGETMSVHRRRQAAQDDVLPYRIVQFAIAPASRPLLHERITERFDKMLEQGFIDEVRSLYQRGDLNPDLPSMLAVGYRQVWSYLAGESDREHMREKGIIATRQLAKRQMTWLRSWANLHWLETFDKNQMEKVLKYLQSDTILK